MASPTWWTWIWANSGSWWWTGTPGVLQSTGSQRVGHDGETELNWTDATCIPSDPIVKKYQSFNSLTQVLVLSEYAFFLSWRMASYSFSLWGSESGTQAPFFVMNTMFSRDISLDQTAPSPTVRWPRTLSPVPWWSSPFSPSPLQTSSMSPFNLSQKPSDGTLILLKAQVSG